MNPNKDHNIDRPDSSYSPNQKKEPFINARLLYLYVGSPHLTYDAWAASLSSMVNSRGHISRFKLMPGRDGELALNLAFACHFAERVADDLIGAIALILIREAETEACKGNMNYSNMMLEAYQALALGQGYMSAKHLHSFLQVEQSYTEWISQLKQKYESDYVCITYGQNTRPKKHAKDIGEGSVILVPNFAIRVALDTESRRGALIKEYLQSYRYV